MSRIALSHVTDWVFDLDNTLYPRTCNLFAQIDLLITQYVMELTGLEHDAARKIQKDYYRDHGTTLNGLMHTHNVDPEHYLDYVHAIDYSPVDAHPELVEVITALPGRKFIFTNADNGHTSAVLERLGVPAEAFDGMFDIRSSGYKPKPEKIAYNMFFESFGIDPAKAVMFDDLQKNLLVPHEMGMATVQVVASDDYEHDQVDHWELHQSDDHAHVHFITQDLVGFLQPKA